MFDTLLETFGRQTSVGQSRTASTNPIQWTLAIVLLGIVALLFAHVPSWLLILLAACFVVTLLLFCYAYLYLLKRNPDGLRSERYVLEKLAIQSRLSGDSDAGTKPVLEVPRRPDPERTEPKIILLGDQPSTKEGE